MPLDPPCRLMLHGSETWALTKVDLQRLQRNDRAMIRHVCGVKPNEVSQVWSQDLLEKLVLLDLTEKVTLVLSCNEIRWCIENDT